LKKYSERGQAYVDQVKGIIQKNNLDIADGAVFRDEPRSFIFAAEDKRLISIFNHVIKETDTPTLTGELPSPKVRCLIGNPDDKLNVTYTSEAVPSGTVYSIPNTPQEVGIMGIMFDVDGVAFNQEGLTGWIFDELIVDKLAIIQIMLLLKEKPLSTGEIADNLGLSPSEVSKYLMNLSSFSQNMSSRRSSIYTPALSVVAFKNVLIDCVTFLIVDFPTEYLWQFIQLHLNGHPNCRPCRLRLSPV
jgi:hypothetical protein